MKIKVESFIKYPVKSISNNNKSLIVSGNEIIVLNL